MTGYLDLSTSMTLQRPWTSQKEGFGEFFRNFWLQRTFQHWIATKWLEIDQVNLRMKFLAFNVDFSSSSPDPLGSRRPAQAGVKDSYPLILPQLSRVAWTRLQIGTDMLLIITSTGDRLFIAVNVDDLEWPWTLKIGGLANFSAIFDCDTHFKSELRRNG